MEHEGAKDWFNNDCDQRILCVIVFGKVKDVCEKYGKVSSRKQSGQSRLIQVTPGVWKTRQQGLGRNAKPSDSAVNGQWTVAWREWSKTSGGLGKALSS